MTGDLPFRPPPGSKLLGEVTALLELPKLALRLPAMRRLPRGSSPVVIFPGYGTDDNMLLPLRTGLRKLGYQPHGWGLGRNRGDVAGVLPAATEQVRDIVAEAGEPAALLGWSNGGVFAREITRDEPELVSRVITFGTPVVGGPRYTRSAGDFSAEQLDEIETQIDERNQIPIERPITAYYSKRDGIVDWRSCIDDFSPDVTMVELASTHIGMTIDADLWSDVARRLASN